MLIFSLMFLSFVISLTSAAPLTAGNEGIDVYAGGKRFYLLPGVSLVHNNCSVLDVWSNYNQTLDTVLDYFSDDCGGFEIATNKSAYLNQPPPVGSQELNLYGVADENNMIWAVGVNRTNLKIIAEAHIGNKTSSALSKRYESALNVTSLTVVDLTYGLNGTFHPHEDLIKAGHAEDLSHPNTSLCVRTDWSDTATYVFYSAGAYWVLKVIQKHTESSAVSKVIKVFEAIAASFSAAVGDLAGIMASNFRVAYNNQMSARGFGAEGGENWFSTAFSGWFGAKRLSCPSGLPWYCECFKAPTFKQDYCTLGANVYDINDPEQEQNWLTWYAEHQAASDYWGTTANHLYWSYDNGEQSFWVMSWTTYPEIEDAAMAYKDCDAASW